MHGKFNNVFLNKKIIHVIRMGIINQIKMNETKMVQIEVEINETKNNCPNLVSWFN